MPSRDPHGRASRSDNDGRRRPSDGFRTASRHRFVVLARRAVEGLSAEDRARLADARLEVEEVPPADLLAHAEAHGHGLDDMPLARVRLGDGPAVVTVYRRPVELRAGTREDLEAEVALAVHDALRDALGLPPDERD